MPLHVQVAPTPQFPGENEKLPPQMAEHLCLAASTNSEQLCVDKDRFDILPFSTVSAESGCPKNNAELKTTTSAFMIPPLGDRVPRHSLVRAIGPADGYGVLPGRVNSGDKLSSMPSSLPPQSCQNFPTWIQRPLGKFSEFGRVPVPLYETAFRQPMS